MQKHEERPAVHMFTACTESRANIYIHLYSPETAA